MKQRIAAVLAAVAAAAGTTVALAPSASAGPSFAAEAELLGPTENVWSVHYIDPSSGCGDPVFGVTVTIDGDPVTPLSQEVEQGANGITVTLPPEGPAGLVEFGLFCGRGVSSAEAGYGYMVIDKVVDGDAPPDARYVVNVACSSAEVAADALGPFGVGAAFAPGPFSVDLPYDRSGGRAYVYSDAERTCDITEPEAGGATSTTIAVPDDLFTQPERYTLTVTNTYVPAPIVVAPTFTG